MQAAKAQASVESNKEKEGDKLLAQCEKAKEEAAAKKEKQQKAAAAKKVKPGLKKAERPVKKTTEKKEKKKIPKKAIKKSKQRRRKIWQPQTHDCQGQEACGKEGCKVYVILRPTLPSYQTALLRATYPGKNDGPNAVIIHYDYM